MHSIAFRSSNASGPKSGVRGRKALAMRKAKVARRSLATEVAFLGLRSVGRRLELRGHED